MIVIKATRVPHMHAAVVAETDRSGHACMHMRMHTHAAIQQASERASKRASKEANKRPRGQASEQTSGQEDNIQILDMVILCVAIAHTAVAN